MKMNAAVVKMRGGKRKRERKGGKEIRESTKKMTSNITIVDHYFPRPSSDIVLSSCSCLASMFVVRESRQSRTTNMEVS